MIPTRTFRTKTGFCHILPDRILLTNNEHIDDPSQVPNATDIRTLLIGYAILAFLFLYFALEFFRTGEYVQSLPFIVLSVIYICSLITSRNNSGTNLIRREKIQRVKFNRGIKGLYRSYFEVFFETDDREIKKRLIMLPGSFSKFSGEDDKALQIMKDEKLLEA